MIRTSLRLAILFLLLVLPRGAGAVEGDRQVFQAAVEKARLVIHGATDIEAMRPLLEDFQALRPDVTLDYVDYLTNDLFREATEACAAGKSVADLLLSSSVDQLVRLANDGCAVAHRTTERVPDWANWREEVYGFTFEPAVMVYDERRVPPEDVPRSHNDLAELLRQKSETYRGRVGTYDIRVSGIGYLLAFNDSRVAPTSYGRLLESLGRAETVTRCCNNEVLNELRGGTIAIAYNVLGSYAYAAHLRDPHLRIVLPRDYTLILSRGALIPATSREKALAGAFLDYLLSERGQKKARDASFYFSANGPLPRGVDGPASLVDTGIGRPIRIGPALLAAQDQAQHRRFTGEWSAVMRGKNPDITPR
ncbi:extracellular solute-binding protein [Shinella kummerowiae]|uniref:Extracellular solute-binding protein n=1 Tax=Shinella kummerowiae TaxID=417745 RepID=A0A6N8SNI0_9HYPH|nr:ABC transporter substrate-binding protein [Shinella kummerowiae]MXN48460.1 extracellular solute-binding protein [Shinella kummerowiae]